MVPTQQHVLEGNPKKNAARRWSTVKLVQMAMLAAVSIVLIYFVRIPLIPAAGHLVYDLADIPILLGAFTLGPGAGMLILTVVSAIQAAFLGGNGFIGFFMHMIASGTLVLVATFLYRRLGEGSRNLVISLATGGICMTAIMIPLNLIFTPLLGVPMEVVKALMLPGILPFNLIKSVLTCTLFFILYKSLSPVLKRYTGR